MFKIVALAAAVTVAHGGLFAAPVARVPLAYASAPIVSSSAITSRSDGYTAVAAPVLSAAPVLAAAPVARAYAAPIAYAASPVVSSSAITSRTDSYNPIVARYAATIAAPIAHTYAAGPLAARIAAPIAYSAGYGIGGLRLL